MSNAPQEEEEVMMTQAMPHIAAEMPLMQAADPQAEIKRNKIKHLQADRGENSFVILTYPTPKCLILMFVCVNKIMGSKGTKRVKI